jgi:hypothetical protein
MTMLPGMSVRVGTVLLHDWANDKFHQSHRHLTLALVRKAVHLSQQSTINASIIFAPSVSSRNSFAMLLYQLAEWWDISMPTSVLPGLAQSAH